MQMFSMYSNTQKKILGFVVPVLLEWSVYNPNLVTYHIISVEIVYHLKPSRLVRLYAL